MTKRMSIMLGCLIVLFGALISWRLFVNHLIENMFSQPQPPVATETVTVELHNWQPYLTSVGTLLAQQSIEVTPSIAGIVSKIYFQSATVVKQGAPLVDLEDSIEQSNLASDRANLKLATANFHRSKNLYTRHAISSVDYDTCLAALEQAKTAVTRDRALIAQKHIIAPFAGNLGLRQISLGEYIMPGGKAIVNLQTLDALAIEFSLTQQALTQIKTKQSVIFTVDAYPDTEFKGFISATNASFEKNSRMLSVRASLLNPARALYPGMYGTVKVLLPELKGVITVPQTAVEYNLYGNTVYVVQHEGARTFVKRTLVMLGARHGNIIIVEKGLQPGDEIVTVGQLKLSDHTYVEIRNVQEPEREHKG